MQGLSSANVRMCDYWFENSVNDSVDNVNTVLMSVNHSLILTESKRITNTAVD